MIQKGQLYRTFIKYVSLNILSMIGLSCYILADTYFIAAGVGSMGVAALNLVLPVYMLVSGLGLMLGMGGATRYAIQRGEGDETGARQTFTIAVVTGAALGIGFTLAGLLFSAPIAELLGAEGEALPLAAKYLQTLLLYSCAFILNQIFVCFVRNDGNPNLTMAAMLIGSLSNVALDYVFIFPFGLGMFGAALATGFSPVISMCVLSFHLLKRGCRLRLAVPRRALRRLLGMMALGVSSFVTELSNGIVMLLFNFVLLSLAGNTGVAAYGIVANLARVVVSIFTGLAQGIQPVVSDCFGRGRMKDCRIVLRCALLTAAVLGGSFCLAGFLWPGQLAAVFDRDGGSAFAALAADGIRLYFTAFILMGINVVAAAYFSAAARALEAMVISLARGIVLLLPCLFLLAGLLGVNGVWLAVPATELLTCLVSLFFLIRYFRRIQQA